MAHFYDESDPAAESANGFVPRLMGVARLLQVNQDICIINIVFAQESQGQLLADQHRPSMGHEYIGGSSGDRKVAQVTKQGDNWDLDRASRRYGFRRGCREEGRLGIKCEGDGE